MLVITIERKHWWMVAAILFLILLAFYLSRNQPYRIPPDRVWAAARAEGRAHDLDPHFIFAIAMAESSLNANADTGQARGIMQMSHAAWRDRTPRPYDEAFDWRINMSVASSHLAYLKGRLEAAGQFDYPRLAAAYRFGYPALMRQEFDLNRMPRTRNRVYQELFAGRIPDAVSYGVNPRRVNTPPGAAFPAAQSGAGLPATAAVPEAASTEPVSEPVPAS